MENGVINRLDDHMHYTYSVYPSSRAIKSKIDMNFYQKPIYNYELKCENDPNRSLETLFSQIEGKDAISTWTKMINAFAQFAVTALVLILVVPIASGKGTFICTPLTFIVVAGLFMKPLLLCYSAADELEVEVSSIQIPEWINDCIDSNVELNLQ